MNVIASAGPRGSGSEGLEANKKVLRGMMIKVVCILVRQDRRMML